MWSCHGLFSPFTRFLASRSLLPHHRRPPSLSLPLPYAMKAMPCPHPTPSPLRLPPPPVPLGCSFASLFFLQRWHWRFHALGWIRGKRLIATIAANFLYNHEQIPHFKQRTHIWTANLRPDYRAIDEYFNSPNYIFAFGIFSHLVGFSWEIDKSCRPFRRSHLCFSAYPTVAHHRFRAAWCFLDTFRRAGQ